MEASSDIISPSILQFLTENMEVIISFGIAMIIVKLFTLRYQKKTPPNSRDVPGPVGFPIFGNLLQLGSEPYITFYQWTKTYGDVIRVNLGNRPVIILNGRRAIQQAMIRQAIDFAGRPKLNGFLDTIEINGGSVAFSSYDEGWKMHRKLAESAVRHFASGKQSAHVEHHVTHEAMELIESVLKKKSRGIMVPSKLMKLSVSNVMAGMIFQERHDLHHAEVRNVVNKLELVIDSIAGSNKADFLPWLGMLFPSMRSNFRNFTTRLRDLLSVHMDKHIQNYESGMDSDIFYYLMTLNDSLDPKQKEELKLTDERVRSTVIDFFRAGFETTAATLLWSFLYAITFPEIQQKVRDEIDRVVGCDRLPSLADRKNLPLTEAFIAEVSRHASAIPTAVPHCPIRDTILGGGYNYFIPRDMVVIVNLYSVHHDPEEWVEPEKFDPTRFLSDDGTKLDNDKVESLIRFGAGRRRCIGSEIAQMELFLFFAIFIQQCELKNVEGQELSLRRNGSMLVTHPMHYQMEIIRRGS